jgi:hypothetical protein
MDGLGRRADIDLSVTADPADVAAFARAVGADPAAGTLPLTYPVAWLTRPEVVALVASLAADRPMALPVHEVQTIETLAPVGPDARLDLSVAATRTDADRITVEVVAQDADRRPCLRMTGILRLFDPAGPAG